MAGNLDQNGRCRRLLRRFLSVPLYTKILSVVAVGAFAFGAVTLFEVWTSMVETHAATAREHAELFAETLASSIDRALKSDRRDDIPHLTDLAVGMYPGCVYAEVRSHDGHVMARSTGQNVPTDPTPGVREVTRPIGGASSGTVRVGIVDPSLDREMAMIIWPLIWTLGLCLLVCELMAVLWARLLVGPINNLVKKTHRIQAGEFDARARVYADDEIGTLAHAFNAMAESLQRFRLEVEEKESARQSLLAKIVQTQEEERKNVSRELHDQLGQTLSKVLLSLQSVHRECACSNYLCKGVEGEVRDAIDEVRRLAWAMRPSILDDFGLEAALARYTQELSRRVDFPIDYQCFSPQDSPRLPSTVEVTLYRVTQEAMTNIMRHAEPTRASIVLLRRSEEVTLVVEDDGRGFDTKRKRNGHMGLISMEERVGLIGGNLTIESRPGKGTAVRVRVTLNERASCPSGS